MSTLPILQRRRERRLTDERRRANGLARFTMGCGSVLAALLGMAIFILALAYADLTKDLPSLQSLPSLLAPGSGLLYQPTRIYDRTGQHVLSTLAPDDLPHTYIPLDHNQAEHLPATLVQLTLATEDPDFYSHPGFVISGLSEPDRHPTLAQRLAADFLLWQEPPGLRRALRERLLAAQITRIYGRDQVLEWYLNSADYGRHITGAQAAARLYFGKPASQLSLAEAALLVATSQTPAINPIDAGPAALERSRALLQELVRLERLDIGEARSAGLETPVIQPALATEEFAPAFTSLAMTQLERHVNRKRVERGGMSVITTLDYDLYLRAECASRTQLARLAGQPEPSCAASAELPALPPGEPLTGISASLVVLDPQLGQVLVVVGEIYEGQESARLTSHKPGSSLFPFIYLTGFSRGLSPASLVWDINPDATGTGPVRARLALANDYPAPAATLLNEMSIPAVLQIMRPFGLSLTDTASFDRLVNGDNLVSPISMGQAYGVFATGGALKGQPDAAGLLRPSALLKVEGADGQVWYEAPGPQTASVVTPQLSYLINNVLSDVSARWPSLGQSNPFELARPVAARPGVTASQEDTWAIGYTPSRVVVVWMGGQPAPLRAAAGLWSAAMKAASLDQPSLGWEAPNGVVTRQVCDPSGLLPTPACPKVVNEIFLTGYEPLQADTLYQSWEINRETGFLSTVFTAPELVESRVYMNIPPEAKAWAAAQIGLETPPTTYDTIQAPMMQPWMSISSPEMFADLEGKVAVRGSASGDGFTRYRLQYGQGLNPKSWVLIAESSQPVQDGILAEWDTTQLHGLYALQLLIIHADGRVETTTVQVTIK